MFEVNVFGRMAITQAVVPLVMKSEGVILNIGSIAGVCPQPWKGMYNASCAAVHHWSDTLRIEMAPFGVRVILVRRAALASRPLPRSDPSKLIVQTDGILGRHRRGTQQFHNQSAEREARE
jgi:short-subunit dehydrogenase